MFTNMRNMFNMRSMGMLTQNKKLLLTTMGSLAFAGSLEYARQGAAHHDHHHDSAKSLTIYSFGSKERFQTAGRNILALSLSGSLAFAIGTWSLFERVPRLNSIYGKVGWAFLSAFVAGGMSTATDNTVTELRLTPNHESLIVRVGFINPRIFTVRLGDFKFDRRQWYNTRYALRGVDSGKDLFVTLPIDEDREKDFIPQIELFRKIITGDSYSVKQFYTHA